VITMAEIHEYRGHIRNWKNLCEELGIGAGLSREERENAIIVKAYEKWGRSMADHIYGMFAFYLYDEKEDKIFAMRDQFGTKPFYYYVTAENKLLCGTMIRGIMEQPGFVKELNKDMLQIYMTLTYVAGEDTFFKGVKKLMPGHWLEFKDGKLETGRYWTPTFAPDDSKTVDEWADEIHSTLSHIFTEVKEPEETVESFLSGGVHSSYVLAMYLPEQLPPRGFQLLPRLLQLPPVRKRREPLRLRPGLCLRHHRGPVQGHRPLVFDDPQGGRLPVPRF
jgi:Asparagine synthase (glutamine-hydrolyzing)